jgi:CheY-like chemotaxis protein
LATHPLFGTYIIVAQLVISRRALLDHEMPEISGFEVFKEMKNNQ